MSDRRAHGIYRSCQFEELEPRRVLSADPVIAGLTYFEGDLGQDTTPDHFEVTFQGGLATTQLTQFTINGDQDDSGDLSDGDVFFDVHSGQPGAGGYAGFEFHADQSRGLLASDVVSVDVSADGLLMTVQVSNFEAGDILAFSADVDEVERFRTDKIASGVEFEGTELGAEFADPQHRFVHQSVSIEHPLQDGWVQQQAGGYFYDEYDALLDEASRLAGNQLVLSYDNQTGHADRTAAAVVAYELQALPISLSGNVFHDPDLDCLQGSDEIGIEGVLIELQQWTEQDRYETVAVTVTDEVGHYEFGYDLGLAPGTYRLVELQPEDYLDVGAAVGQVDGTQVGTLLPDGNQQANVIAGISIPVGNTAATDYNFCEVRPASLSGHVWHDRNDNGFREPTEEGIAQVSIRVVRTGPAEGVVQDPFSTFGSVLVQTDGDGFFSADQLPPGVYEINEVNVYPSGPDPLAGWIDGQDSTGTVDGQAMGEAVNDRFRQVVLEAAQQGVQYDFGELRPAVISGYVSLVGTDGLCVEPTSNDHQGLEGVTVELYTRNQRLVQTTLTDADGYYEFDQLRPGTYGVVEVQPSAYLDGHDHLGQVDGETQGVLLGNDRFSGVRLASGQVGTMYNFCEQLPAELSGAVWYDANRDGLRDVSETGIQGALVELFNEQGIKVAQQVTDVAGNYSFTGLAAGQYSLREIQPAGFIDGGEVLGNVVSSQGEITSPGVALDDRFDQIALRSGDRGQGYDFGEFRLLPNPDQPGNVFVGEDPTPRPLAGSPQTPIPGITSYPTLAGSQSGLTFTIGGTNGSTFEVSLAQPAYTWHLSVVNAGQPRSVAEAAAESSTVWQQVAAIKETDWSRFTMSAADWSFTRTGQAGELLAADQATRFGTAGGTPVVGDFDGDGVDEIAVYHEGYWMIDINRNGQWDSEDLLARLGGSQDRPVVGDWDGDGKEDIGIYGPMWPNDIAAISHEPGLPNPDNRPFTAPKNIPAAQVAAADGARIMKLTSYGQQRADLVDHVFGIGTEDDVPVAGDWNGNGIRSIGKFNGGLWHLDINGDGKFDQQDAVVRFGQPGDYPLTGDFNGDGIEEIAVYRAGTWWIDVNGNRQMDAADLNYEMGELGDQPVVGDWDGDGIDEPGLYRAKPTDPAP
ncbi:MAG: hypothetical protein MK108_10765 [Mariniblastus sp.]|nr:hypothetical protein [Mariniblastus sp.]